MYYIISEDNGQLIELQESCPTTDELATLAEECECDLWVIEGEHSGITYERPRTEPAPDPVIAHLTLPNRRPAFSWDS